MPWTAFIHDSTYKPTYSIATDIGDRWQRSSWRQDESFNAKYEWDGTLSPLGCHLSIVARNNYKQLQTNHIYLSRTIITTTIPIKIAINILGYSSANSFILITVRHFFIIDAIIHASSKIGMGSGITRFSSMNMICNGSGDPTNITKAIMYTIV